MFFRLLLVKLIHSSRCCLASSTASCHLYIQHISALAPHLCLQCLPDTAAVLQTRVPSLGSKCQTAAVPESCPDSLGLGVFTRAFPGVLLPELMPQPVPTHGAEELVSVVELRPPDRGLALVWPELGRGGFGWSWPVAKSLALAVLPSASQICLLSAPAVLKKKKKRHSNKVWPARPAPTFCAWRLGL